MTRLMLVVVARHDYQPTEEGCIPLKRGEILLVMNRDDSGWWDGISYESRQRGWFPSEYVMTAPQEIVDKVIREQDAQYPPTKTEIQQDEVDAKVQHDTNISDSVSRSRSTANDNSNAERTRTVSTNYGSQPLTINTAVATVRNDQPRTAPIKPSEPTNFQQPTITLQLLIDNILQPISELRKMQQLNGNDAINFANNVVRAVRSLLYHTGVRGDSAPALQQYPKLRDVRKNLLLALSQLVSVCKLAAQESSPPADTLTQMHAHAFSVLENVKHFIMLATELQLELITEPIDNITVKPSGNGGLTRLMAESQANYAKNDKHTFNIAHTTGTNGQSMAASSQSIESNGSSSAHGSAVSTSKTEAKELYEKLDSLSGSIRNVIQKLLALIENGQSESDTLQTLVRETVNLIGRLLTLLSDVRISVKSWAETTDRKEKLIQFSNGYDQLFSGVKTMYTTSASLGSDTTPTTVESLAQCIAQVRTMMDSVVADGMNLLRAQDASQAAYNAPASSTTNLSTSPYYTPGLTSSVSAGFPVTPRTPTFRGRKNSEPHLRTPLHLNIPAELSITAYHHGSPGRSHSPNALAKFGIDRDRPGIGINSPEPYPLHSPLTAGPMRRLTDNYARSSLSPSINSKMMKVLGVENAHVASTTINAQKPKFLMYDYEEGDIRANMENQISGGTWPALVERLTPHDTAKDEEYVHIFLLTFRSFATPQKLADQLIERFRIKPPPGLTEEELELWRWQKQKPVRIRVMHIVKIWLEKYFFPTKDEVILPRLLELAQMHAKISPKDGQAFVDLVKKKMSEAGTLSLNSSIGRMSPRTLRTRQTDRFGISRDTQSEPPPTPNLPRSVSVALKTRNLANMTDIDPLEMARQLTIMDNKQFCAVHPYELINQEFTRKDSRIAVNVRGMTDLSNQMSTWAAESILFESDLRRRVAILKYLIKVADKCASLHNYNSMMAILSAINSVPVERLRKTWEAVPNKTKLVLQSLRQKVDHRRNFKEYRERIRQQPPPCIPFFGIFLTDLTFTAEGNPDYKERLIQTDGQEREKLINFEKYRSVVKIIQQIQSFQVPYNLVQVDELQDYLRERFGASKTGGDSSALYHMSLVIEPKEESIPTMPPPPLPIEPTVGDVENHDRSDAANTAPTDATSTTSSNTSKTTVPAEADAVVAETGQASNTDSLAPADTTSPPSVTAATSTQASAESSDTDSTPATNPATSATDASEGENSDDRTGESGPSAVSDIAITSTVDATAA